MNISRLGLVLTALAALGVGCQQSERSGSEAADPTAAKAASGGRLFAVSFQTMNNPFFVELEAGIKEVVEAHGDRLTTLDAAFNALKQKNDVSDVINQEPAAVFINPVNWEGVRSSLLQAKEKGVPCIIIDAPAKDRDLALCTVASDNVEAGRMAARALAKARKPANIVILHLMLNKACIDRVAGFKEELAKYPDMKILAELEGEGTRDGGRRVMRDCLERFDLNAVFPINDPSALGAISALESANKLPDVTVVTVDGSPDGIAAIHAGKLHSTSAQFPREIGRIAAQKAYDHLEGKPVDNEVKVRVELITKDNVGAFSPKN